MDTLNKDINMVVVSQGLIHYTRQYEHKHAGATHMYTKILLFLVIVRCQPTTKSPRIKINMRNVQLE